MLVGYSSSSEEDGEETTNQAQREDDGLPATKKVRTERDVTNSRLPLPGFLLSMFPDDEDAHTEDSSLHSGRIRSFKHERGNWATYVYLPYRAEEDFAERLEELLSAAAVHGVLMKQQQEFHLSLSQTVVLKHHWIQPFTQSLRKSLSRRQRFVCSAGRLKVYCNEEKTRTFLGMESSAGHTELLDLVQVVDRTMTEFCLPTFYKNPSFHVSLAWCVGDKSVQMKECLLELQRRSDDHEEGAFLLRMDCEEVRCQTGNKTFRFPLVCKHAT